VPCGPMHLPSASGIAFASHCRKVLSDRRYEQRLLPFATHGLVQCGSGATSSD
jgi:hypothetical protein